MPPRAIRARQAGNIRNAIGPSRFAAAVQISIHSEGILQFCTQHSAFCISGLSPTNTKILLPPIEFFRNIFPFFPSGGLSTFSPNLS
jgi:hypothetical protein